MNKEEHFLASRLIDLANTAYDRNIYTYSEFLNLNEQSILNGIINELPPINLSLLGGNDYAERKIAVFAPREIYYQEDLPICIIEVAPINSKYADKLTHRDYLGAILNLGINRNKIGDIFIKDLNAYIYCKNDIAEYILDNLTKIKHTLVNTSICNDEDIKITPNFKEITGTISNIRLDSLISSAFNTSRSSIISYIEGAKVFVNGKLVTSNGYSPKEGDIISVRGKGRFIYDGCSHQTKKGRNFIRIRLYI